MKGIEPCFMFVPLIGDKRLMEQCRIGDPENQCRYLQPAGGEFGCMKNTMVKKKIDLAIEEGIVRGTDNCEGIFCLILNAEYKKG